MENDHRHANRKVIVAGITAFVMSVVVLGLVGSVIYMNMSNRYGFNLPGGFRLMQHFDEVWIQNMKWKPDDKTYIVGPGVSGYRVYTTVITGCITPNPNDQEFAAKYSNQSSIRVRTLGYFIIDVQTKKSYAGLNKPEWMRKLNTYGITKEPEIYTPNWLDEKRGRNKPLIPDQR